MAKSPIAPIYEISGATAAGLLRGKLEKDNKTLQIRNVLQISGVHVDAELVVGAGLFLTGYFRKFNPFMGFGTGMLAHYAGEYFREGVQTGNYSIVGGGPDKKGFPRA